jgi:hypothetical protein
MKIFQRAGCGCIIIPVDVTREITVDYCGESQGVHFSTPGNQILPDNRTKAVWLTEEEHLQIFAQINQLIVAGRKFEDVTRALGIKS